MAGTRDATRTANRQCFSTPLNGVRAAQIATCQAVRRARIKSGKVVIMATSALSQSLRPSHPFKTIVTAGLLAGILDGADAAIVIALMNGIPAARVFQFIASGALGVRAFKGGNATAALGVALHFTIAMGAAAAFYLLSTKLPMLLRRPLLWGPVYGIGVFFFMHYIVVPLSATPRQPPASTAAILNLLFSHIFFVGIPIALVTSRAARESQ